VIPFTVLEEIEDPALLYVIERYGERADWKGENAHVVIEGYVSEMTYTWTLRRGGRAGDTYDSDELRTYTKQMPTNLKCDLIIRKPLAAIIAADGDLGIVREVMRQIGRTVELASYGLMVQHLDTLHTIPANESKPQSGGVTVLKGGARPTKTAEVL